MVELNGEHILIPERMIVSPADGIYKAVSNNGDLIGEIVNVGDVIGHIESIGQSIEVTSPFHGTVHGIIAHTGERLRKHEPVAWLRVVTA